MKGKFFQVSTMVVMAMLLLFGSNHHVFAATEVIKIKGISFLPSNAPNTTPFLNFVDHVNKQMKGKVLITYAGGPEVISGREQIEALRNGVMEMGTNMAGASSGVVPEFNALMPSMMSPKDLRESGYLALLDQAARKKANITYLAHLSGNFAYYLFWNPEVKNPRTDFKGMKLRGGGTYNPGIKALGAEPISIALPEMYSALQRGIVDGTGQPLVGFLDIPGLEKTLKYCHVMDLSAGGSEIFMNLDKWNALPKDIQQEITAIAIEEEQAAVKFYEDIDNKVLDLFKKSGLKIVDWGAADNKYFEDIWRETILADLQKKIPESYAQFKEILDKYKK